MMDAKTEQEFVSLQEQVHIWKHLAIAFEDMYYEAQHDLYAALEIIKEITHETE